MEFNGIVFNDHEPYVCKVQTDTVFRINDHWYSVKITEKNTLFKGGVFKSSIEDNKPSEFETLVLTEQTLNGFFKSGTTICVKMDTTNDNWRYIVIRRDNTIKKKEVHIQFELP